MSNYVKSYTGQVPSVCHLVGQMCSGYCMKTNKDSLHDPHNHLNSIPLKELAFFLHFIFFSINIFHSTKAILRTADCSPSWTISSGTRGLSPLLRPEVDCIIPLTREPLLHSAFFSTTANGRIGGGGFWFNSGSNGLVSVCGSLFPLPSGRHSVLLPSDASFIMYFGNFFPV